MKKPKKYKLMLISFAAVYPTVLTVSFLLNTVSHGAFAELPGPIVGLVMASIFVPVFGTVIPALHKRFYEWTIK